MSNSVLEQLKARRKQLKLKQKDMMLQVGMSRQQYQQLESKGNPRLDTLLLIAKGLKSELMLIPSEKLEVVRKFLQEANKQETPISDNPWKEFLEDEE